MSKCASELFELVDLPRGLSATELAVETLPCHAAGCSLTILTVGSGSTEAEGKDRRTLGLPAAQQQLLEAVHAAVSSSSLSPKGKLVVVRQTPFLSRVDIKTIKSTKIYL